MIGIKVWNVFKTCQLYLYIISVYLYSSFSYYVRLHVNYLIKSSHDITGFVRWPNVECSYENFHKQNGVKVKSIPPISASSHYATLLLRKTYVSKGMTFFVKEKILFGFFFSLARKGTNTALS